MARREQLHGHAIQDAGLNQRAPLPAAGLPAGLQYREPPSVLEMMESRAALQNADIQNFVIEDHQQLVMHKTSSQNIDDAEKEIKKFQADIEAAYAMRRWELLVKMEAGRLACDALKKEVLQRHLEVHKLRAGNQKLSVELQKRAGGLAKENKRSMRSEFEYSRDINTKQIEQTKTMEMSIIAVTKQVDKSREDMENAAMRSQGQSGTAQAQAAYGSAYSNLPAAYGQATDQAGQSGVAQAPAASAAIYPYAPFPGRYAYQQVARPRHYAHAAPYADARPMARHQVVRGSGYAGYSPVED